MDAAGSSVLDRLGSRDREYLETLDEREREVVASTILRYQRRSLLQVGDPLPALALHRLDDGQVVQLAELVEQRPLVLVFGSFT